MEKCIKIAFIFILALYHSVFLGKVKLNLHKLGPYKVVTSSKESVESTTISHHKVLRLGIDKNITFTLKKESPQSIISVKNKIKALKADPKSLKYKKYGKASLFYFASKDSAYIFSTLGDMVIVTGPKSALTFKKIKKRVKL